MRSKKLFLKIVLGLIVIGGFIGWNYIKSTQQFSLYKTAKAVEAHDYETFTKYFDIDSVVDNVLDKAFKSVEEQVGESSDDVWYELGKSFAEGLVMTMKPAIKEQLRADIKREIEAGSFWEDYRPANVIKAFTKVRVQKEGKVATVTLTTNKGEPFSLKMRQKEGYWQIFDFAMDFDLPELSEEGGKREEKPKAEVEPRPKQEKAETPPPAPQTEPQPEVRKEKPRKEPATLTRIEGLAAIYVSSVWINWDADAEDDGAKVGVAYWDSNRDIVSTRENVKVPISADVKAYTKVWSGEEHSYVKDRLVYSAHISSDQFVTDLLYPWFKIPEEQINADPSDYEYGLLEVTIHTPEQGDFSGVQGSFQLYN